MAEDSEIQIGDVESYGGQKDSNFSHQALVMQAMKKCVEFGTMEQTQGVYLTETDNKGHTKLIYRQDIRKAFVESVRTAKMIMICDFDDKAKTDVNALFKKIGDRKKELIKEQWKWYDEDLNQSQKNQLQAKGILVREDSFSTDLPFYQDYLFEELEIYRDILEELTKLTERRDFYKGEEFEA